MNDPENGSRIEDWLAYIAGEADEPPEAPESRVEWWLKYIAENGGGGGGGDASPLTSAQLNALLALLD